MALDNNNIVTNSNVYKYDIVEGEKIMNEKTNTISEEKLELGRKINTLPEDKNFSGGKPGAVKDLSGFWTDAQIAANPLAYIAYLRKQLEGEYHNDKIRDIISEIEDIEDKYVKTEEEKALGRNR